MSRQLTVVYTINNEDAFSDHKKIITDHFMESKDKPWAVTAQSMGDEMHRLYLIEEAHNNNRHDLLDEIFGLLDPQIFDSLEDLDGYGDHHE